MKFSKIDIPELTLPDGRTELRCINGICAIYRNNRLVGTLDSTGSLTMEKMVYVLSVEDDNENGIEARFSTLDKVLNFLLRESYLDIE
jgi:hypothetical protein